MQSSGAGVYADNLLVSLQKDTQLIFKSLNLVPHAKIFGFKNSKNRFFISIGDGGFGESNFIQFCLYPFYSCVPNRTLSVFLPGCRQS